MSAHQRNLLVGVTMMVSLVLLGWMILRFGAGPARLFAPARASVTMISERADGLGPGAPVLFRGVTVGRVDSVRRTADGRRVEIGLLVDEHPPVPANVEGYIRYQSALGATGVVTLELTDPEPEGALAEGHTIQGYFAGLDVEVIPPQIARLAETLERQLAQTQLVANLAELIKSLEREVPKLGELAASVNAVAGDPQVQKDLQESIANIREMSVKFNALGSDMQQLTGEASEMIAEARTAIAATSKNIESVSTQFEEQLRQNVPELARSLQEMQKIMQAINEGTGTAGMMLHDPKLYESLVATSTELNLAVTDLRRVLEQIEEEGPTLRLVLFGRRR
jgi:virulence factor Mce-like protein